MNARVLQFAAFLILCCSTPAFGEVLKQNRQLQNLWLPSGFQIGVESNPEWTWFSLDEKYYDVFVMESPEYYYPPSVIQVRYSKHHAEQRKTHFHKTAYFTILNVQKRINPNVFIKFRELAYVSYGELNGYEQVSTFNKDGVELSNKVFVGLNSQNKLIVLSASTLAGKMEHIQPQLNRMWGSIRFLNRMSNQ
ncbi:MAG: hypothetical protein AAGC78_02330 [Cellvibrio sp.]|uniref:hypothetical protein n=1 Tax=Cellvibrio sp. TaxID=1965322 RepID=UPI0031A33EB6